MLLTALLSAIAAACSGTVIESSGEGAGTGGGGATHVCTAVFADCNGDPSDGCEVDLQNDGAHCGSCDHDCQGSACEQGICAPEIVLSDLYFPNRLALDEESLYWTNADGHVRAKPMAGGDPHDLAAGQDDPWDIAVNGFGVYWTDSGSNTVAALPFGGDVPQVLADAGNPLHLVTRGPDVYFTDTYDKASESEHVRRVPAAGGPVETLGSSLGAWAVAVDDARVYWTDPANDAVWRMPVSGGVQESIATGLLEPADIEVDAEAVYVTGLEATYRIPFSGGEPEPLVWGAGRGLAIRGGRLYVGAADGRLLSVPVQGGPARVLSKGPLPPSDLVASETHVYWIVRSEKGAILRTPR